MIVLIFLLLILTIIIGLWIFGFVYANDFSIRSRSLKQISSGSKKVLIVFPHADDEVLSTGGLISALSHNGVEVYWYILTKGEKGNETATIDENLKNIRINESKKAAQIYGINNLVQSDYPDNGVDEYKDKLSSELRETITNINPDLIITYDLAGLYGHPDHIVVSEMVTELVKKDFSNIRLWYVSFPKKILDTVLLPEQMAKDEAFKEKRSYPDFKVWVGFDGVLPKIQAVYTYKSQRQSYANGFPIKFIPLWFYVSLTPYEYYYEAN